MQLFFDDAEDNKIKADDFLQGRGWKAVEEHDQSFLSAVTGSELLD